MARAVTAILMVAASSLLLASCAPQEATPGPGSSGVAVAATTTPDTSPSETSQPSGFWAIIDESRKNAGRSTEAQSAELERILSRLPLEEVVQFDADFIMHSQELYSWELWGAAYVLMGGCSDDGFLDFRLWTVAQGKDYFDTVLINPSAVGDGRLTDIEETSQAELFSYVAAEVYEAASGTEIYDNYPDHPNVYALDAPTGEAWDEDELESLYPDIAPLDWS